MFLCIFNIQCTISNENKQAISNIPKLSQYYTCYIQHKVDTMCCREKYDREKFHNLQRDYVWSHLTLLVLFCHILLRLQLKRYPYLQSFLRAILLADTCIYVYMWIYIYTDVNIYVYKYIVINNPWAYSTINYVSLRSHPLYKIQSRHLFIYCYIYANEKVPSYVFYMKHTFVQKYRLVRYVNISEAHVSMSPILCWHWCCYTCVK